MKYQNNWAAKLRGFDSKFEMELKAGPLRDCKFHPGKITYTIPSSVHTYEIDFQYGNLLIESKGYFEKTKDAEKYVHIRRHLKVGEELVFVFMKPATPMPGSKARKDGTRRTMAEWAEKNDFKWFTRETIVSYLKSKKI